MEELKPDEATKLKLIPLGKKHPVRARIENMKVDDKIRIHPNDFKWKDKTPRFFCNQISRTTTKKFVVEKDLGTNGWVVTREE